MKLNHDKKPKNTTYFIQMRIRNGKKTTIENVKKIGKRSGLLAITPDPLVYAKKISRRIEQGILKKGKLT